MVEKLRFDAEIYSVICIGFVFGVIADAKKNYLLLKPEMSVIVATLKYGGINGVL